MSELNPASPSRLTRRSTLKGAAYVAGAAWVAPVVQVISMESAAAASAPPSGVEAGPPKSVDDVPPPKPAEGPAPQANGSVEPDQVVGDVSAETLSAPPVQGNVLIAEQPSSGVGGAFAQASPASSLPKTGSDATGAIATIGVGALVAGGAAMVAAARRPAAGRHADHRPAGRHAAKPDEQE